MEGQPKFQFPIIRRVTQPATTPFSTIKLPTIQKSKAEIKNIESKKTKPAPFVFESKKTKPMPFVLDSKKKLIQMGDIVKLAEGVKPEEFGGFAPPGTMKCLGLNDYPTAKVISFSKSINNEDLVNFTCINGKTGKLSTTGARYPGKLLEVIQSQTQTPVASSTSVLSTPSTRTITTFTLPPKTKLSALAKVFEAVPLSKKLGETKLMMEKCINAYKEKTTPSTGGKRKTRKRKMKSKKNRTYRTKV